MMNGRVKQEQSKSEVSFRKKGKNIQRPGGQKENSLYQNLKGQSGWMQTMMGIEPLDEIGEVSRPRTMKAILRRFILFCFFSQARCLKSRCEKNQITLLNFYLSETNTVILSGNGADIEYKIYWGQGLRDKIFILVSSFERQQCCREWVGKERVHFSSPKPRD